jgi:hypothetical protein
MENQATQLKVIRLSKIKITRAILLFLLDKLELLKLDRKHINQQNKLPFKKIQQIIHMEILGFLILKKSFKKVE